MALIPKKNCTILGIEFTQAAVRAARTTWREDGSEGTFLLEGVEELSGDFANEAALIRALKDMKQQMVKTESTRFVTCVYGKQVYAVQLSFRRMPMEEMREALRFEIRKSLPFDIAQSTVDYQMMEDADPKNPKVPVIVAAVANPLLNKHLQIMEKAGIKPDIVDVLPLAAANAFWAKGMDLENGAVGIVLYITPGMITFVAEGEGCQFFHRSIYFSAEEIYARNDDNSAATADRTRRIEALAEEVVRSISFYRQTYSITNVAGIFLMGEYADLPELIELLKQKTGISIEPMNMAQQVRNEKEQGESGKYDLAIALSMRTDFA